MTTTTSTTMRGGGRKKRHCCTCLWVNVCIHPSPIYIYITLGDATTTATAEGCQMVKLAPDTRPFYTPHPVGVAEGSGRPTGRLPPPLSVGVRHEYTLYIILLRSPKLTLWTFTVVVPRSRHRWCFWFCVFFLFHFCWFFLLPISASRPEAVTILREQPPKRKKTDGPRQFFFCFIFLTVCPVCLLLFQLCDELIRT